MRQRNAAFKKEMEQLHEAARLVTSQSNTATLATAVWKELSETLSAGLVVLTKIPKVDPRFDRLIEEHKALMRDFATPLQPRSVEVRSGLINIATPTSDDHCQTQTNKDASNKKSEVNEHRRAVSCA